MNFFKSYFFHLSIAFLTADEFYLKNKFFLISIISLICLSLIAFQEINKVHN